MRTALVAALLMAACSGNEPTMGDYASAYAEAIVSHSEGCGPLTGNREKTIEYIVGETCRLVDCGAPAEGDIAACLDAIDAMGCDASRTPAECVDIWY